MYQKVNRNSLGQQLRRRERLIHASSVIILEREVEDKNGVKHTLPPTYDTRGIKPRVNPLRRAKNKKDN